jgi:osmotically-inducible protein OsmY
MKKLIAVVVMMMALVAVFVSGCGTVSGTSDSAPADRLIANDVRDRLAADPDTGPCNIGVSVTDGVVTLRGSVPNEVIRLRAKGIARGTDGVKGIVDSLFAR